MHLGSSINRRSRGKGGDHAPIPPNDSIGGGDVIRHSNSQEISVRLNKLVILIVSLKKSKNMEEISVMAALLHLLSLLSIFLHAVNT